MVELIGSQCKLVIEPHDLKTPSIVYVNGYNPLLNTAFALGFLGYSREMLWEVGFETEGQGYQENYNENSHHYVGPYFRWEISGFWATVKDEITLGVPVSKFDRFDNIVSRLGISHLLLRSPGELSGGETVKVILAAHLIHRPRKLILDRIFSEIDNTSRPIIIDTIKSVLPSSIVFILDEVLPSHCDYIVYIQDTVPHWMSCCLSEHLNKKRGRHDALNNYVLSPLRVKIVHHNHEKSNAQIFLDNYSVIRSGVQVFASMNCTASSGDFVLLKGPNGSGKTSFIEGLAGLLETNGSIAIRNIDDVNICGSAFSLSPQDPQCDITENDMFHELAFACNDVNKLNLFIEQLSLPKEYLTAPLKEDIGLQKLASILAAILRGRICCLLDEPNLYLSSELRIFAQKSIIDYLKDGGIVFCSSHDTEFERVIIEDAVNYTEQ